MSRRKRNQIAEQFSARVIRMLESPAYRALSLSAHRVLSRIEIEHAHHGGADNGKLPVTYDDFQRYGVDREAIAPAMRECVALGFLEITEQGHAGNAEFRSPNKFRLTYIHASGLGPTHEWQRIETEEQAKALACAARNAKDDRAVLRGKWHSDRRRLKQNSSRGKPQVSVRKTRTENRKAQWGKSGLHALPGKPVLLSISRVGATLSSADGGLAVTSPVTAPDDDLTIPEFLRRPGEASNAQ
jgi:hypothetical protein